MLAREKWLLMLLVGLAAMRALWPGEVPWILDEPMFVQRAMQANSEHRLATMALMGNHGVPYGPGAIWIYQGILLLTHNPFALVIMRAVGCALVTAVGLHLLARAMRVVGIFSVVIMCSPFLWYYDRKPWDNSFLIPLSAVGMGCYASFLRERRDAALLVTAVCVVLMPLIHLMGLMFSIPVAAHLVAVERKNVSARWWGIMAGIAILFMFGASGYLAALIHSRPSSGEGMSMRALAYSVCGFRHISAMGLEQILGMHLLNCLENSSGGAIVRLAIVGSGLIYFLALVGLIVILKKRCSSEIAMRIGRLSIAMILFGMIVAVGMNAWGYQHYFNGVWIAYAVVAWIGVDFLWRQMWGRIVVVAQGLSVAVACVLVVIEIHQSAGSRQPVPYGMVLKDQVAIADELLRNGERSELASEVPQPNLAPIAIEVLKEMRRGPVKQTGSAKNIVVKYASHDECDAHVVIEVK